MQEVLKVYINYGIENYLIILRIVIGVILICDFKMLRNVKSLIVYSYYGFISFGIIGIYLSKSYIGFLIGASIGIILSCFIYNSKNENLIFGIMVWLLIFDFLDIMFYTLDINFSELLKKYDDIYREYWSIYVKFIITIIVSILVFIGYLVKINKKSNNKLWYLFIGNQFVIGALFASTGLPMEKPDNIKDVAIPLLNVNISSECYLIPLLEVLLVVMVILYKKRKDVM